MAEKPPVSPWLVLSVGVFAISTGNLRPHGGRAGLGDSRLQDRACFPVPSPLHRAGNPFGRPGTSQERTSLRWCSRGLSRPALRHVDLLPLLHHRGEQRGHHVNAIPLWTGLLLPLLTGDPFSSRLKKGLLLALPGGVIIGWGILPSAGPLSGGIFSPCWGSFFAALYILFGRRVRPRMSLTGYVTLNYGTSALVL